MSESNEIDLDKLRERVRAALGEVCFTSAELKAICDWAWKNDLDKLPFQEVVKRFREQLK